MRREEVISIRNFSSTLAVYPFSAPFMESKNLDHRVLHGVTLAMILDFLVAEYGFEKLGEMVRINCFTSNPSIQSSLKFLRKTEWARLQVQGLYVRTILEKKWKGDSKPE